MRLLRERVPSPLACIVVDVYAHPGEMRQK